MPVKRCARDYPFPFPINRANLAFLVSLNKWMTQFQINPLAEKDIGLDELGFDASNSPNSFICRMVTNHLTGRSS